MKILMGILILITLVMYACCVVAGKDDERMGIK